MRVDCMKRTYGEAFHPYAEVVCLQPLDQLPAEQHFLYDRPMASPAKKAKGRTGWPQHVWALDLQEQAK